MRKRTLTENMGCHVTREDIAMVKQHARSLKLSVSDYLRQVAVQPLKRPAADEVQDGEVSAHVE